MFKRRWRRCDRPLARSIHVRYCCRNNLSQILGKIDGAGKSYKGCRPAEIKGTANSREVATETERELGKLYIYRIF